MQPPPHSHHPRPGRLRRWLIGLGLLALLTVGYGLSLNWFVHRLGDGVEKSLQRPEASDSDAVVPG